MKFYFSKKMTFKRNQQRGVSLVEAMVSLLIFTIGALGLAALQLSSLSGSADSEQRTLAIWKAQEFADRIRSNPGLEAAYITAIGNDEITNIGRDTADGVFVCPAVPQDNCSDPAATCTDAQIVAYDIWDVFCDANTGVLNVTTAANQTVYGSSGFNQLEIVLRQLEEDGDDADSDDDGTGDMELYLEWVSQAGERSDNSDDIQTNLCSGRNISVEPALDTYCMRFR